MTRKQPTKIDRTEFARLAAEGLTPEQLAAHFGTRRDTAYRIRRQLGMTTRKKSARINRDELLHLHEQGKTTTEIAEHFGCNVDSISRVKAQLGIQQIHDATPERLARITQMIEDGWSFAEIARTEGMCRDSLRRHFPGQGWTQEQITEYLRLRRQETGRHFNERPKHYDQAKYDRRTHPYGATKQSESRTLEAAHAQHGATRGRSVQNGLGRVIGHAA